MDKGRENGCLSVEIVCHHQRNSITIRQYAFEYLVLKKIDGNSIITFIVTKLNRF